MGLSIDNVLNGDSVINIATIRSTIENVHTLLLFYEDFDEFIKNFSIADCSRVFMNSYKKLSETFGFGLNDNYFSSRYTSIPLNTYSLFASQYKNDDYLTNSLNQYFSDTSYSNKYLDSVVSGSQNFAEIYANVLKDVSVNESSDLADKMIKDFYKKFEILVKALYFLAYKSFQLLSTVYDNPQLFQDETDNTNEKFYVPPPPTTLIVLLNSGESKEVPLADLLKCFINLGLLGYFVDILESYCMSFIQFTVPPSISDKAYAISQDFNIGLHLKHFLKDQALNELIKTEISSMVDVTLGKLLLVNSFLKHVTHLFNSTDTSTAIQPVQFAFDEEFSNDIFFKLVDAFFRDFCEVVSLLLPISDAFEIIGNFKCVLEKNNLFGGINYFETYLEISLRNWENQLLDNVRTLSQTQYPPIESADSDISSNVLSSLTLNGEDHMDLLFIKSLDFGTIMNLYNSFLNEFLRLAGLTNIDVGMITQNLSVLTKLESCYISNSLFFIVSLLIKVILMPVMLTHELSHNSMAQETENTTQNEILLKYIENNSKLIQNVILLYVFNSNSSFKDFLYNISKVERDIQGLKQVLKVFVLYISNVYYINHLASLLPYLVQFSYQVYSNVTSISLDGLIEMVRKSYKISLIKISLLKLQDFLIVHLSALSQQYVQKLLHQVLHLELQHTSTESTGSDIIEYLTYFKSLVLKYLPNEVSKSVIHICIDLVYNCIIFEVLDFFEEINYKFNQNLFNRVKIYIQSTSMSIDNEILNDDQMNLTHNEKFNNFLTIFSHEHAIAEHLYSKNEYNKIVRLIKQIKTF
ncbi:hypothetical protein TpMuguga_03g00754 [Theileria parva strain Muguga]|uniref:uncharacterized protein n=1 Tax=Theileria parva strain Muguga TaxID=333668 RepID=UPI001C621653|nr:uncharacterized protein TpMuguga_03g00754 [Theileria parva strain Muguga]EAN30595.2 hypothetical protein TpMuguga_03g00754 [Theileria parva strain Muguga]